MKSSRTTFSLVVLTSLLLCVTATAQQTTAAITLEMLDGSKTTYTIDQLRQMPQHSVTIVNPHSQTIERYEGVHLSELLQKAGAPSGDKLRGDEMRDYVEVTGRDGYKAVFALAELDPAFQDSKVLVAIASDGKALDEKLGPVRVVAPQDKRPARSVRMVSSIAVRRAP